MAKIQLESRNDGVVIPVRAKPAARRNSIEGIHDGALRVSVTAAPEKGKANKAIGDLLAKALGVSKSCVTLVAGQTSPHKRFLVSGKTGREIRDVLLETAGG